MGWLIKTQDAPGIIDGIWLRDVLSPFDVVAALSASLTPAWHVERSLDPSGDLSIIVLPACENALHPSFVLYEKDGLVEVATVVDDAWQGTQIFPTCQGAVAVVVAAAVLVYS